jgi:NTE family protein
MPGVALVLGAGGMVGQAFHAGVLSALADELGWDARDADLLVGTSAGSIVATMLRAGMPPADIVRWGCDLPLSPEGAAIVERTGSAPPLRPLRQLASREIASPALLRRAARAPWAVTPGALAAALLPEGRVPTEELAAPIAELVGPAWPDAPTWIVAVQLDTGRRTVFGRDGEPAATPAEALRASCAIPALFEPAVIGGERYVDGAVHSSTNADLVASLPDPPPDLVVISAPMAPLRTPSPMRRVPRPSPQQAIRRLARLALARELAALRERGIRVVVFRPSSADLARMNGDTLDPANFAPVAESAAESARRRLARPEVREHLSVLA